MVALNASAGLSSQLIGRVKHYKLVPSICLVISIAAVVVLSLSVSHMTPLKFEIILFVIGIGFGPTPPLSQVALQNTVPSHDLGAAIGTMNFARSLAGTIMIAVFGAIVFAGAHAGAPTGALDHNVMKGTPATAFAMVFLVTAGTLAVAFVSLLLLEEKPLLGSLPAARR
jgi:MFS family permease